LNQKLSLKQKLREVEAVLRVLKTRRN
ncbi:uncharacterized protein METZ01_LOCUS347421, partial [marine metagenome]